MKKGKRIILGVMIVVSLLLTTACDTGGSDGGGTSVVTYAIGDTGPAGGLIFFKNGTVLRFIGVSGCVSTHS